MKQLFNFFKNRVQKEVLDNGVREALLRSHSFLEQYQKWKSESLDFTIFIKNRMAEAELSGINEVWFTYMHNPQCRGFMVHRHPELPEFEWDYGMEFLKERLVTHYNYVVQRSLRHQMLKGNSIVELRSYYLKPDQRIVKEALMHKQVFGNILIEIQEQDRTIQWFKLQANYYSGRSYEKALDLTILFE